ncbi:MAG: LamG domain-containing protein [Planctomycetota bacterium]
MRPFATALTASLLLAVAALADTGPAPTPPAVSQAVSREVRRESGLVLRYRFEDGSGTVAADSGPNVNHATVHGATFVKDGDGHALLFDGLDDYLECPSSPSLTLPGALTLEAWVKPDRPMSGEKPPWAMSAIVGKGVACYEFYGLVYKRDRAKLYISSGHNRSGEAPLPMKTWSHVVGTFDGNALVMYVDGKRVGSEPSIAVKIRTTSESLFVGRNKYPELSFFPGAIDEVKVYDRALSDKEVFAAYQDKAKTFGKEVAPPTSKMQVRGHAYRVPGVMVADVDLTSLLPLPEDASLDVVLSEPGSTVPTMRRALTSLPDSGLVEVSFGTEELAAGDYEMRVRLHASGRTISEEMAGVTWPDPPAWRTTDPPIKVLNNLVMELLHVAPESDADEQSFSFTNPREGWVFFASEADVKDGGELAISLNSNDALLSHVAGGPSPKEAMRFLPEGRHDARVRADNAQLKDLVVRAIPEIHWCKLYPAPYLPEVKSYGPYDWAMFKRSGVLDNANVMVSRGGMPLDTPEHERLIADWNAQGKKWIVSTGFTATLPPRALADQWLGFAGMGRGDLTGILLDEFGISPAENFRAWAEALRIVKADERSRGKTIYPYCAPLYECPLAAEEFIRTVAECDYRLAWEVYLGEEPTVAHAEASLDERLRRGMAAWRQVAPGIERNLIVVLGFMSAPPESLDREPAANYKVFMDMQMNLLANAPEFAGLFGVQEYTSAYADEEIIRWTARLYRHYCIEGRRDRLSNDPYELAHISSGDFEEGGREWTLSPADEGSITFSSMPGYGFFQGRYPPGPAGTTFLCTRRSGSKPNTFSQTISGLAPGRLYSVKMICADPDNMTVKEKHALSVHIEGVDILEEKSVQESIKSRNGTQPWVSFVRRVFRAKGNTAELSVSDWASLEQPGGPIGQNLIFNFIQVEPYLED